MLRVELIDFQGKPMSPPTFGYLFIAPINCNCVVVTDGRTDVCGGSVLVKTGDSVKLANAIDKKMLADLYIELQDILIATNQ